MRVRVSTSIGGPPWWQDGDVWIRIYLVTSVMFVVGAAALLALWPSLVEAGVQNIDDRWTRRLVHGESLLQSGRYERAVAYLENLDAQFPAKSIKHKRDKERERLLAGLAEALEKTGRRGRAVRTLERLAEFDPRNVTNHYLLGCALRRDGDEDQARGAFENVLKISPYHFDATRALVELDYESGRFANVVETCRRFVDAVHFVAVTLSAGDRDLILDVPADGVLREIRAPLNLAPDFAGSIQVRVGEAEHRVATSRMVIESAWVETPLQFGRTVTTQRRTELDISENDNGDFELNVANRQPQNGISSICLNLRIAPIVDVAIWDMIERSYRNALAFDELEGVRKRVLIQ